MAFVLEVSTSKAHTDVDRLIGKVDQLGDKLSAVGDKFKLSAGLEAASAQLKDMRDVIQGLNRVKEAGARGALSAVVDSLNAQIAAERTASQTRLQAQKEAHDASLKLVKAELDAKIELLKAAEKKTADIQAQARQARTRDERAAAQEIARLREAGGSRNEIIGASNAFNADRLNQERIARFRNSSPLDMQLAMNAEIERRNRMEGGSTSVRSLSAFQQHVLAERAVQENLVADLTSRRAAQQQKERSDAAVFMEARRREAAESRSQRAREVADAKVFLEARRREAEGLKAQQGRERSDAAVFMEARRREAAESRSQRAREVADARVFLEARRREAEGLKAQQGRERSDAAVFMEARRREAAESRSQRAREVADARVFLEARRREAEGLKAQQGRERSDAAVFMEARRREAAESRSQRAREVADARVFLEARRREAEGLKAQQGRERSDAAVFMEARRREAAESRSQRAREVADARVFLEERRRLAAEEKAARQAQVRDGDFIVRNDPDIQAAIARDRLAMKTAVAQRLGTADTARAENEARRVRDADRSLTSLSDRYGSASIKPADSEAAITELKRVRAEAEKLARTYGEMAAAASDPKAAGQARVHEAVAKALAQEARSAEGLRREYRALNDLQANLQNRFRGVTGPLRALTEQFHIGAQAAAAFRAATWATGSYFGGFSAQTLVAAAASYGLVRAFTEAITVGKDFERTMTLATRVAGNLDVAGQADASRQIRDMAVSSTHSALDSAKALQTFSLAGFNVSESMTALKPVLDMALVGVVDVSRAAEIATDTMHGFGMTSAELPAIIDKITFAANKSTSSVESMGTALSYVAPVAAEAGTSLDVTLAILGKLHDAGIKGTRAGTTLRAMMMELIAPTDGASATLAKLGLQVKDSAGNLKSMEDVLVELARNKTATQFDFAKLFDRHALTGVTKLIREVRDEAATTAKELMASGVESSAAWARAWEKAASDMRGYLDGHQGYTADKAKLLQDDLQGGLDMMLNAMKESALKLADVLGPDLKAILKDLRGWFLDLGTAIEAHSGQLRSALDAAVSMARGAATLGAALLQATPYVLGLMAAWKLLRLALATPEVWAATRAGVSAVGAEMATARTKTDALKTGYSVLFPVIDTTTGSLERKTVASKAAGVALTALGGVARTLGSVLSLGLIGYVVSVAAEFLIMGRNAESAAASLERVQGQIAQTAAKYKDLGREHLAVENDKLRASALEQDKAIAGLEREAEGLRKVADTARLKATTLGDGGERASQDLAEEVRKATEDYERSRNLLEAAKKERADTRQLQSDIKARLEGYGDAKNPAGVDSAGQSLRNAAGNKAEAGSLSDLNAQRERAIGVVAEMEEQRAARDLAANDPLTARVTSLSTELKKVTEGFKEAGGSANAFKATVNSAADKAIADLKDASGKRLDAIGASFNRTGMTQAALEAEYQAMKKTLDSGGAVDVGRLETIKPLLQRYSDAQASENERLLNGIARVNQERENALARVNGAARAGSRAGLQAMQNDVKVDLESLKVEYEAGLKRINELFQTKDELLKAQYERGALNLRDYLEGSERLYVQHAADLVEQYRKQIANLMRESARLPANSSTAAAMRKEMAGLQQKMVEARRFAADRQDVQGTDLQKSWMKEEDNYRDYIDKLKAEDELLLGLKDKTQSVTVAKLDMALASAESARGMGKEIEGLDEHIEKLRQLRTEMVKQEEIHQFAKEWDKIIERIDESFVGLWEDLLNGQKSTFETLNKMAVRFAAEYLHQTLTKNLVDWFRGALAPEGAKEGGTSGGAFSELTKGLNNVFDRIINFFGGKTTLSESLKKSIGETGKTPANPMYVMVTNPATGAGGVGTTIGSLLGNSGAFGAWLPSGLDAIANSWGSSAISSWGASAASTGISQEAFSVLASAGILHRGGIAGEGGDSRSVPVAAFAGAARFHMGGIAGDEVPAILRRGEEVLTEQDPRHRGNLTPGSQNSGDGPPMVFNFYIQTNDVRSFNASRGQISADIASAVRRANRYT